MCVSAYANSVWFSYTPSTTQSINMATVDSEYDTVLAVFTENGGILTSAGCDDDGGPGTTSSLNLNLRSGITYHILVAKYGSSSVMSPTLLKFSAQLSTPPLAPSLLLPINNANSSDRTPNFEWNIVNNANAYQVQIASSSTFSNPNQDWITSEVASSAEELVDGIYYWRVRAYNYLDLPGAWSTPRRLTIDTLPPAAPDLFLPDDEINISDNRVTFMWETLNDAIRYELQYGTTNPPAMSQTVGQSHIKPQ